MFTLIRGGKPKDNALRPTVSGPVARVLLGDPEAFRELLLALRPKIQFVLRDRYAYLGYAHQDLADEAETVLFTWLKRPGEGLLRPDETIAGLAFRLLQQVVRTESRYRERKEKIEEGLKAQLDGKPPEAEVLSSPELKELLADLERLPETHRSVLWAEIRYERGEGPPPHEVLEVDMATYRQRLHRARAALEVRIQKREKGLQT